MIADFPQLAETQKAMADAISKLEGLKAQVGLARQIVEFSTDRCKSALSAVVVGFLKLDMSAAAAEHHARASEQYKSAMKKIMTDTAHAETVLKTWELAKIQFEAARSLMSAEKSMLELR
jgi:hypothetical protein